MHAKLSNVLASLLARPRREEFLAEYVIRESRRGRSLADILDDRYVTNRSTPAERARLLERPELVQIIGEQTVDELRRGLQAHGA